MPDAFTAVGARLWIGDDTTSFELRQAAGSATLTPEATLETWTELDTGDMRRVVTGRMATAAIESLYWRPSSDDLLTWLAAAHTATVLMLLANGAAWALTGPVDQLGVSIPTDNLVQVSGSVQNGEGPIALTGGLVLTADDASGDDWKRLAKPFGAAGDLDWTGFDWDGGHDLYAVTVVDRVDHAAAAVSAVLRGQATGMRAPDGPIAAPAQDLYRGPVASGVRHGAGIQRRTLTSRPLVDQAGIRGTLRGTAAQQIDTVSAKVFVMQEFGACLSKNPQRPTRPTIS